MADLERARSHHTEDGAPTSEAAVLGHSPTGACATNDASTAAHTLKRAHSNDDLLRLRVERQPPSKAMTPRSHTRTQLGLPPTPPTLTNSDVAEPRGDSLAANPQFADAVRKALNSHSFEHKAMNTPSPIPYAPHTPDPTPPSVRNEQRPKTSQNRPQLVLRNIPSHHRSSPSLGAGLSSQAESFRTALESTNTSQLHLAQELSPPQSPLTQDLIQSSENPAVGALHQYIGEDDGEVTIGGTATPKVSDEHSATDGHRSSRNLEFSDHDLEKHLKELKLVSDSPLIVRSKRLSVPSPPESPEEGPSHNAKRVCVPKEVGVSPSATDLPASNIVAEPSARVTCSEPNLQHTDNPLRAKIIRNVSEHSTDFGPPSGDLDKHITYIESDEAEKIAGIPDIAESALGDVPHQASHESSAEGLNNDVYREIREKNVKRHSAGCSLSVGIIIPHQPVRTLKRVSRYDSLRESVSEGLASPRNSVGTPRKLRHMKPLPTKSLEASPASDIPRSPGKIPTVDVQSSPMTSLTRDALVENEKSQVPSVWRQHTLRRNSKTDRLGGLDLGPISESGSPGHKRNISGASRDSHRLRHFSKESQLENNMHVRRTSIEVPSARVSQKSGRNPHDPRFLNPNMTPLSTTVSYRIDAELCEATGMSLLPVSDNNAVQMVFNTGSVPMSPASDNGYNDSYDDEDVELHFPISTPPPEVMLRRRTMPAFSNPEIGVESPHTNPREAPEPPVIYFIPPTPSNELEVLLLDEMATAPPLKRNTSLKDRAKRYSENYIVPFFIRSSSYRRNARKPVEKVRPDNLSPMWKPRYFWEDYESDEEYDEDDLEDGSAVLPPGGDTSEVQQERSRTFPRNMSVRMPGFRGSGGFLVGNSLGLDRHGTNSRRHHVVTRRASEEMLRGGHRRRRFLPFASRKGKRFHNWRDERQMERRRATLKSQIQHGTLVQ